MSPAKTSRTVTVVEGRKENKQIITDFEEAAKKLGWECQQLLYLNSDRLARYDLSNIPLNYVVFRYLSNNYAESERLLYYLKQKNAIVINANVVGGRSITSDKHFQQGLFLLDPFLKNYALPTFEAKSKPNVMSYINGGRVHFPIVLKYRNGTTGKNITLIKNEQELDKIKNFNDLLIEQYIEPECDWRVFVMGGAAVGIMRKKGDPEHPEDFTAWSGGRARTIEKDQDTVEILSKIACRAAEISRLEYTGVDIIRDANTKKLYILETNYAAGWMNFTPITKINIPEIIINWMEERSGVGKIPIKKLVERYIENRKKYLAPKTAKLYDDILAGKKGIIPQASEYFARERSDYLYDTGAIFNKLSNAYTDLTKSTDQEPENYKSLIREIESMPLSWAGNFIGPEVGTLDNGAILSALYLFILGKIDKV